MGKNYNSQSSKFKRRKYKNGVLKMLLSISFMMNLAFCVLMMEEYFNAMVNLQKLSDQFIKTYRCYIQKFQPD